MILMNYLGYRVLRYCSTSSHVRIPRAYWNNFGNQKAFLQQVGSSLGVKDLDDWKNVTLQQVLKAGGGSLLHAVYGNSLQRALKGIYPSKFSCFVSARLLI